MTDVHDIESITFGVYSDEEIRGMAVCKIENKELHGHGSVYDKRMGTLGKPHEICETCNQKQECPGHFGYIELAEPIINPLFYKEVAMFLKCFCKNCHRLLIGKENIELSGLDKLKGSKKFAKILEKLKKSDMCSHCSSPQPKISFKSKDMTISMEYKQKKSETNGKISIVLTEHDIKAIFDVISDEDVILLGFNPKYMHPRNLIFTAFPVMPPSGRPPVMADENICDDDITYQLLEIIKINNQLLKLDEVGEKKKTKLIQSLKFRVSTMMNNSNNRARHPTDHRSLKGIKERLSGKTARMRGNLLGKRIDQSSRTVIGADPTLKLGQVAIPEEVASTLTKAEVVCVYNIDKLTEIVNSKKANRLITTRDDHSGSTKKIIKNIEHAINKKETELLYGDIIVKACNAGLVKKPLVEGGKVKIPKKCPRIEVTSGTEKFEDGDILIRNGVATVLKVLPKEKIRLKLGDIVERQLVKGDMALFNRQPTLHKGSMLAMEVVPMPYKSFRFNLGINKSYNADFDGDEMNLHPAQTYETEVELKYNSSPKLNIISPQESKNIITIVQDSLIACYMMTKNNMPIPKGTFFDISSRGDNPISGTFLYNQKKIEAIEAVWKKFGKIPVPKPTKGSTTKAGKSTTKDKYLYNGRALFSLLLPETLFYENKNNAMPDEPIFKVYRGVVVEGAVDKAILGSAHNSLIQILNKEYGADVASTFIDNIHFISGGWMAFHGFSVGLEDCLLTSEEAQMTIKNTLTECYVKAQGIEETTYNSGIKEVRVTAALSQARDIGMKISKDAMNPKNNFLTTVISGAKGDYFNIAQLTSLLGQQNLEGQRVSPQMNHRTRSLPHYPFKIESKEREYESRGFVKSSFIKGLSPEEFFFHSMSGREGCCDTAMSTANSGYIQRKIIKTCEDIQVRYDGTIRDSVGKIYQHSYGDYGLDPTKTVLVDSKPQICDISRLTTRLNMTYELGLEEESDLNGNSSPSQTNVEPDVSFEIIETKEKESLEKHNRKKLIKKIKKAFPTSKVDKAWTISELRQRFQALKLESALREEEELQDIDEVEEDGLDDNLVEEDGLAEDEEDGLTEAEDDGLTEAEEDGLADNLVDEDGLADPDGLAEDKKDDFDEVNSSDDESETGYKFTDDSEDEIEAVDAVSDISAGEDDFE